MTIAQFERPSAPTFFHDGGRKFAGLVRGKVVKASARGLGPAGSISKEFPQTDPAVWERASGLQHTDEMWDLLSCCVRDVVHESFSAGRAAGRGETFCEQRRDCVR